MVRLSHENGGKLLFDFDFDLKLRLNGKRIYPTKSIKYLGIKIDEKTSHGLITLMILQLSLTGLMLCYLK